MRHMSMWLGAMGLCLFVGSPCQASLQPLHVFLTGAEHSNHDVRAALAGHEQRRAEAEASRGKLLPGIDLTGTYTRNAPNMWSLFSVDESLGMVYLPMGNQTPDQFAGGRTPTSEKYGAGLVALDIASGKVKWNYQFTHHDLWDMDVGGQPSLVDLTTDKGVKPAIIASTKQGSLYVLDRRDGTPIVPIREVPRPQGAVEGDHTAATQPMSDMSMAR